MSREGQGPGSWILKGAQRRSKFPGLTSVNRFEAGQSDVSKQGGTARFDDRTRPYSNCVGTGFFIIESIPQRLDRAVFKQGGTACPMVEIWRVPVYCDENTQERAVFLHIFL